MSVFIVLQPVFISEECSFVLSKNIRFSSLFKVAEYCFCISDEKFDNQMSMNYIGNLLVSHFFSASVVTIWNIAVVLCVEWSWQGCYLLSEEILISLIYSQRMFLNFLSKELCYTISTNLKLAIITVILVPKEMLL